MTSGGFFSASVSSKDRSFWPSVSFPLYRELGQGEKAIRAYRRALAISPDFVEAWCGLAQAAAMTGDTASVQEARQKLSDLAPPVIEQLERCLESMPQE